MRLEVYNGFLRTCGEEDGKTLQAAGNYANLLIRLESFEEAKTLMRKTIPVARRVLGDNDKTTLRMRWNYAAIHYRDTGATLDDLREALTALEEIERTARRVLGDAHPTTAVVGNSLRQARAALRARETPESA